MSKHNHHFIVNRIEHKELEALLDYLLAHYCEGTAEGDDLKARFEVQGTLTLRDEETAAHFKERCAFLTACYASKSFPPAREALKRHVLSVLTGAARDALYEHRLYTAAANGDGHAVLDTGRAAVFKELEAAVRSRVATTPDAAPSSLTFYRDAPPSDWAEVGQLGSFIHDKQAHDVGLRREMALVETLGVGEDIKQLMRMYLTRAGNNYANALRYYHTSSLFSVFRKHADQYALLLFYTYEERGMVVRGLQYGVDAGDYIEGFGGR